MICPKCGADNPDNSKFCAGCGENFEQANTAVNNQAQPNAVPVQNVNYAGGFNGITSRNIALSVLFSIITCGIYGLYWLYKINQEVNSITKHEYDTSGGLVILFTIITCGLYNVYWAYKIGVKLKKYYSDKESNEGNELPVLYLILMVVNLAPFTFGNLICKCLMQDKINKIVENR